MSILYFIASICTGVMGYNYQAYDQGYEAAWEGKEAPSKWASKEVQAGYEEGLYDAYSYDDGYYDGYHHQKSTDWDDPFYQDGYKDGQEDS